MGENRLITYWNNEVQALLTTYKQFEVLIPSKKRTGAAHYGEDGRYVENMLKSYLIKYLPKELEILTGFILRPAVACGKSNKERLKDEDAHSTQLDLIVYDTAHFPVFQRIDDSAVVPPEGVIAIISLKKNLYPNDIFDEVGKLRQATNLCKQYDANGNIVKKPFTALVSMSTDLTEKDWNNIFKKIEKQYGVRKENGYDKVYGSSTIYEPVKAYDEMVGFIGAIQKWTIYKTRKKERDKASGKEKYYAEYRSFVHDKGNIGAGFQYLLKKILDTYYDKQRNTVKELGFVSLSKLSSTDVQLGLIEYFNETI